MGPGQQRTGYKRTGLLPATNQSGCAEARPPPCRPAPAHLACPYMLPLIIIVMSGGKESELFEYLFCGTLHHATCRLNTQPGRDAILNDHGVPLAARAHSITACIHGQSEG